jgi:predicted acyltransferase
MNNSTRYIALDVFRGMTIALMILVNNPGSWSHIYAPLEHSAWHGCTPTDLVFPFFLFIVGVSMFFSFAKYGSALNKSSAGKVLRRAALIFLIGLFLNSFPQWLADYSKLRIMGVLQRIALVYLFGSLIVLSSPKKWLPYISLAIILIYWALLYFLGGADPYSLNGNYTSTFDAMILGKSHMYQGFGITFDPEGLFSTLPAIASVIIGYIIGEFISKTEKSKLPLYLLLIGLGGMVIGYAWGLILPINKPIWTSSYVIYTAGWACVIMSILIWIIDIKGYSKWASFFLVFGMNSLFIFALSGIWARILTRIIKINVDGTIVTGYNWLYINIFQPLAGDINGSLLFAISHIIVFWFICWVLYKKRIFIKV